VSGEITKVVGVGSTLHLQDVLLVPGSRHQLVSVGALADQTGADVVFTNTGAYLVNCGSRTRIAARSPDGLYRTVDARLHFDPTTRLPPLPRVCAAAPGLGEERISFQLLRESVNRVHRIFGHASKGKLKRVLASNKAFRIHPRNAKLLTDCHACALGRAKQARRIKVATTKSQDTVVALCRCLKHGKIFGPYNCRSSVK